jgi:UDP-2,3-diacylglucosamine pyrophosphatase LpxH
MKVCVISDLHLGVAGEGANDFRFDDEKAAAFIAKQAAECDWVIVAGDLWELWEPSLANAPQTEELFKEICRGWPQITRAITEARNIVILTGNHDSAVSLRAWLPKVRTEVLVPELSLFVAHGHQGDRAWCSENSPCLPFVRCLACCVGCEENLFDPDFDEKVSRIQHLANTKTSDEIQNYGFAVAGKLGVGIVCFGHTHKAELAGRGDMVYANCGKWVGKGGLVQLVTVETLPLAGKSRARVSLSEATPNVSLESRVLDARDVVIPPGDPPAIAQLPVLPPGAGTSQWSRGSLVLRGGEALPVAASFLA